MELQKHWKHFFSNLLRENELGFTYYFAELKILKYLAKVIIMNLTKKSDYGPLRSIKTPVNECFLTQLNWLSQQNFFSKGSS